MNELIDQAVNIRVIEECLKSQLRPDWDIRSNWRFGNQTADIVAVHPMVGLAIFKVVTLPTDYSFAERDALWKANPYGDQEYEWDLLADPREEIQSWIEEAETLIQSSLPNAYQNFMMSTLIVFQTGDMAEGNSDHLAKRFAKKIGKTKVRVEYISTSSKLEDVANRLIPADKEAANVSVPENLWIRIQREIIGNPFLIIGELPPPMNDFDGEQIKFLQKVESESLSRLRGPAGSGKSTVVARLAADAVLQEKKVLIVTRNKSMATFLRDRIFRYVVSDSTSEEIQGKLIARSRELVTITHQENWWKMVFGSTGFLKRSNKLYAENISVSDASGKLIKELRELIKLADSEARSEELHVLLESAESKKRSDDLAIEKNQLKLLETAISRGNRFNDSALVFDLVVIDEAQNMLVENWKALKQMVRVFEGKCVVVADPTQSLYGKRPWTDKSMPGFRGPWSKLSASHRLPANCVELVHQFNEAFPSLEEAILPEFPKELDFFPDAKLLRVVRSSHPDVYPADAVANAVVYMRDHEGFSPYEIAFLVPGNDRGIMVVKRLLKQDHDVKTTTSFNEDTRHELGIGMGIRGSTVHSFAGWESPCVILDLDVWKGIEDPNSLIYSALTRVRKRRAGSALVVIDGENQYSEFFKQHTQTIDI